MRSGRAVVGAASGDLMNQSLPRVSKRVVADKSDKWNHSSTTVATEFQVLDPGQQYADYIEGIQHSSSCEKSRHYRESLRDSGSPSKSLKNMCYGSSSSGYPTYPDEGGQSCFRCEKRPVRKVEGKTEESKIYNYEDDETEFLSLKEFDRREQAFYDYYYVQNPQLAGRDFERRSSDCGLQRLEHTRSFPFVLRGRLKKSSKCRKNHSIVGQDENPDYRLTRSLEELPGDIKDHILKCKCSCDHLGYGNYSTLSLKELPGNGWRIPKSPSKSLSPGDDKQEPLMKYKQRELEIKYHVWGVVCLVLVLAGVAGVGVSVPLALKATPTPPFIEEENTTEERLAEAKTLLSETVLVDGHNDLPWNIRKFMHNRLHSFNMTADLSNLRPWSRSSWSHTDLPRLRKGHVGAQFWVAYIPCESQYLNAVQLTIEQIDLIKRMIEQYPNDLRLAASATDVENSFKEGQIASLIGVEGGHAIQNSLGVLRALSDLGVRYMTLTHTCSTPWAECARNKESDLEDPDSPRGLTHFGKTVVREMNRLGILVDLSHASQATMRAALLVSRSPVLFSHSSVYAICKNPRNIPDDILKKVAANGGLVMVSFYNQYLTCSDEATIKDVINHINHVRKIAGVDHVGIGADFDGVNQLPSGLEDVSKYPNLFAELMSDSSWTEEDLKKLAGLNLLRVLRDVETISQKIKEQNIGPYEEDVPFREQKFKNNCAYKFLKDDRS